ncbi:MAG: Gfo/Idh/MocA family oxidoreductase [Planctomycetia bacterium]|nr:Gfo/Idh/MocA family oxidoreductase [Planctomycetia bacterium]
MEQKISRRSFTKTLAAGAPLGLAAIQASGAESKIIGANDTIRVGFVGVANRGRQVLSAFLKSDKMQAAALCDVDSQTLANSREKFAPNALAVEDFRELLDRKDIDALVFATPDHWHAFQCIEACKAGKDVYVEKPLSSTVKEGRMMIDAAKKYGRVVQVGIHRRSSPLFKDLCDLPIEKKIGKIAVAHTGYTSNMATSGMGKAKPTAPPASLNWDLWLGPKGKRPYQENIAPYKFRWWIDYCSQIANQGVHHIDAVRWLLHEEAPVSVCAMGGRFAVDDDRTIPDTMEAIFQFKSGRLIIVSVYESSGNPIFATDEKYRPFGNMEFRGINGTLYAIDNRYVIKPERGGQYQNHAPRMKEEVFELPGSREGNTDLTAKHAKNFLDCMRSRAKTNCDLENAQRSTTMALIANISLAVGRRLEWNAEKEEFINDPDANQHLFYEYRAPWKLEI